MTSQSASTTALITTHTPLAFGGPPQPSSSYPSSSPALLPDPGWAAGGAACIFRLCAIQGPACYRTSAEIQDLETCIIGSMLFGVLAEIQFRAERVPPRGPKLPEACPRSRTRNTGAGVPVWGWGRGPRADDWGGEAQKPGLLGPPPSPQTPNRCPCARDRHSPLERQGESVLGGLWAPSSSLPRQGQLWGRKSGLQRSVPPYSGKTPTWVPWGHRPLSPTKACRGHLAGKQPPPC